MIDDKTTAKTAYVGLRGARTSISTLMCPRGLYPIDHAKVGMYLLLECSSSLRTCEIEVDPGPRGRRMTRSDFIRQIHCCSLRSAFVEDAKMGVGMRHPFSDDGPPQVMYVRG